jgi:hypothetical protein
MSAWVCGCGAMNLAGSMRCRRCFSTLGELGVALAGRSDSSPQGVPARRGPGVDPETDPTCLGTKAYLDGIVSGLSRLERRAYYGWLAAEVKCRNDENDDLMAETEGD